MKAGPVGNATRSRAGEKRVAIEQARRGATIASVLSDGVLRPDGNLAELPLDGDSLVAVLQGGKLLSATLDDIGTVVASSGGLSASAAMVRTLGC